MSGFFSMDGPFYKFGNMIADIMIISLLWLVFSLPLVTAGAATTAAYYVMTRRVSDRETYVWRDFWSSFKRNFKTATLLTLSAEGLVGLLVLNIFNIDVMGNMAGFLLPLQYLILLLVSFTTVYVFPTLSRFDMGYATVIKSSFFMSLKHLPTTAMTVVLLLAAVLITWLAPPFLLFAPGIYLFLSSYTFMRLFRKYRPEIDKEPNFEELRQQLAEKRAAEAAGEGAENADRVFDDAAGLLIEKQAKQNDKKGSKRR